MLAESRLKKRMEDLNVEVLDVIDSDDIKLDCKIPDLLAEKRILFESEFEKSFRLVTTSIDFKTGQFFYQRVKFIVEPCRLLVFSYHNNNQYDPNEQYNPLLVLDFNQVTAAVTCDKTTNSNNFNFRIMVLGHPKNFKFTTTSKEIFQTAITYLNYYITNSAGSKTNLLGISLRLGFEKVNIYN